MCGCDDGAAEKLTGGGLGNWKTQGCHGCDLWVAIAVKDLGEDDLEVVIA